ncbi:MAG: methyltransferase domain-containing protein [Candidatus Hydrogenedentota bacterium]
MAEITMRALWWEGMCCGLRNIVRMGNTKTLRHALRLILCPVDLWRYVEFGAVLNAYCGGTPVLDIGSPKLLSLVLARRFGAKVIAGDIVRHIGDEVAVYARAARPGIVTPPIFDARALPYPDNSLPFVYSVSVIEHIGGKGDTKALEEIGRVLQAGGTAVITVPIGPEFREIWLDRDPYGYQPKDGARVFFSYVYDEQTLQERLVEPSGLKRISTSRWADDPPGWYETQYLPAISSNPIRAALTKLRDFRFARRHIRRLSENAECAGRGIAILTLRK